MCSYQLKLQIYVLLIFDHSLSVNRLHYPYNGVLFYLFCFDFFSFCARPTIILYNLNLFDSE